MAGRKRILLIDDEEDFCFFIKQNLMISGGFLVTYATNSDKGISLAKRYSPDLILLDIRMPKRDGFAVLKTLKENPKTLSIPIIMLTAVKDDGARLEASRLYGEDYLTKPVTIEELKAKINTALERKGVRR